MSRVKTHGTGNISVAEVKGDGRNERKGQCNNRPFLRCFINIVRS